ncbi:MAG: hypothetical protein WBD40_10950 [Tepidisphaeraceae bacterium]
MKRISYRLAVLPALLFVVVGCGTTPKTQEARQTLHKKSDATLAAMKQQDASLDRFIDQAHAYAVFPSVGKGGLIGGGAYGRGVVYEQGEMVGYADVTQATLGLQVGGQALSELIVFQNEDALSRFKSNSTELTASFSAVLIDAGAAKAANYRDGVVVFADPKAGLMVEAAVGGQKFTYVGSADAPKATDVAATDAGDATGE